MDGIIFNIQRLCKHDGPGLRTTIFLKGCPLRCLWCHNPESTQVNPIIIFSDTKCIGCGNCVKICENNAHVFEDNKHKIDYDKCVVCKKCVENCVGALDFAGYRVNVCEIMRDILRDEAFYKNSGGGVTLSGGEPLLQFDFSLDILKNCKEKNIHTAIETCGYCDFEKLEKISAYTDLFLYDFKLFDDDLHKKYTGVSNKKIIENLYKLDDIGAKIILRLPIIPDVNDNKNHFDGVISVANKLENIARIDIMPYNPLASAKFASIGQDYKINSISSMKKDELIEIYDYFTAETDVKVEISK